MSAERTIRSLDALVQAFSDGSPIEVPLKQQEDTTYVGRTYLRDGEGVLKEVLVRAKPIDKDHFAVSLAGISFDVVDTSSDDNNLVRHDTIYLQYRYGRGLQIAGLTTTPLAGQAMSGKLWQELFGQPAGPALERDERTDQQQAPLGIVQERKQEVPHQERPQQPPAIISGAELQPMPAARPTPKGIDDLLGIYGNRFSQRLLQSLVTNQLVTGNTVVLHGGTHAVPYLSSDGTLHRLDQQFFIDTLEYDKDQVETAFRHAPIGLLGVQTGEEGYHGKETVSAMTALFLDLPQPRSDKPSIDNLVWQALPLNSPDPDVAVAVEYVHSTRIPVSTLTSAFQQHFMRAMEDTNKRKQLMKSLEYCDEDDIREQAVAARHGAEAYQALRDLQQYAVLGMVPQDKVEDWIEAHLQRGEQRADTRGTQRATPQDGVAASIPRRAGAPQHPQYDPNRLVSEYWVLYHLGTPPGSSDKTIRARDMVFGEFRDSLRPAEVKNKIRYYRTSQFDDAHFQHWNRENTENRTAQEVLTDPNIRAWNPGQFVSQSDMSKLLGLPPNSIKNLIDKAGVAPTVERSRLKQYTMKDVMPMLSANGFHGWLEEGVVKLPPFTPAVPQEPSFSIGDGSRAEASLDDIASHAEERQPVPATRQQAEPRTEEKRWYENGVLPIFTLDLSQKQGTRAIGTIRDLARAGEQAYVVSFKRTERQQDIVFLTEDNIDLFFKDTATDDYRALLGEIRTGQFNKVVQQPFGVFTARTLEDHPGAYTAVNDVYRALKTYQGYKLDTSGKAFIFIREQEASHFVASQRKRREDGSWETAEERTAMLQQTIREQYEGFVNWKPTGAQRTRAAESAGPARKEFAQEQPVQDSIDTSPAREESPQPPTPLAPAEPPTPQYSAMPVEYVFPIEARSKQQALTTVVEAYKGQYVQRVLADLANRQIINGESIRIGDGSFQLDMPVSIDDLARELHRSKQSIERKIALFPREAVVKKDGETLLHPVTALSMYHHLGEHPPKHPCNVGTVMGELLLDDKRDKAILDYLHSSGVVKAYALTFEDVVVLHTELTRHLASVMASPEQRVRALKQIGYISEEEYDTALQSAKSAAASLAKLTDATPAARGDGKARVLTVDSRTLTYQRGQPERVVDGNAIHYYQRVFNERSLRARTGAKDSPFYGTVVRHGEQQVGYEELLPLNGLVKFLGASDTTVREHLTNVQRDYPRDLVSVTTSGPAVSPFTALFLLPPGSENGAKRHGEDVMAYLHLEEQVDKELLRFMQESGMMNGQREMLSTRFFGVWQQLGMNFAQLMSDDNRRELFMRSQGYISKAEALKRLTPVSESGSTRYSILRDEMRGEHFVFGMVHEGALTRYIEAKGK